MCVCGVCNIKTISFVVEQSDISYGKWVMNFSRVVYRDVRFVCYPLIFREFHSQLLDVVVVVVAESFMSS